MMNTGHQTDQSEWTLHFATQVHRFRIACAVNQLNNGTRTPAAPILRDGASGHSAVPTFFWGGSSHQDTSHHATGSLFEPDGCVVRFGSQPRHTKKRAR
jgi:hypothetical protein